MTEKNIEFPDKISEARHVMDWHLHSDKTTDPKLSDMTIEEAEIILHSQQYSEGEMAATYDSADS